MAHRGIYITENVVRSPWIFDPIVKNAKAAGIDTLVIDAKDTINKSLLKLLKAKKLNKNVRLEADPWLLDLTHRLHKEGFIISVRLPVFKDEQIALVRPDLAIRNANGTFYRDTLGSTWANPYSEEIQLYNILLAEVAAMSGADEVQLDYIRFPAEANLRSVQYGKGEKKLTKVDIIIGFMQKVKAKLERYNVSFAVDIFGVTAWAYSVDVQGLGQDMKRMAKHIDVIAPMLYPSHFNNGYDGYARPGDNPYYFIYMGVSKTKANLGKENVTVVPWIQGFNMRSSNFGPDYIRQQIKAAEDAGTDRFLIWNASNDYAVSFDAMKTLKRCKKKCKEPVVI